MATSSRCATSSARRLSAASGPTRCLRSTRRRTSTRTALRSRRPYLQGRGVEIGAFSQPNDLPPDREIAFYDRYPAAKLREVYDRDSGRPLMEPDYVGDAETLDGLPDRTFDFVIANHVIEHLQDPILFLQSVAKKLAPGGRAMIAAPDKRYCMDRARSLTPFEHLVEDHERGPATTQRSHYLRYFMEAGGMSATDAETATTAADIGDIPLPLPRMGCAELRRFRRGGDHALRYPPRADPHARDGGGHHRRSGKDDRRRDDTMKDLVATVAPAAGSPPHRRERRLRSRLLSRRQSRPRRDGRRSARALRLLRLLRGEIAQPGLRLGLVHRDLFSGRRRSAQPARRLSPPPAAKPTPPEQMVRSKPLSPLGRHGRPRPDVALSGRRTRGPRSGAGLRVGRMARPLFGSRCRHHATRLLSHPLSRRRAHRFVAPRTTSPAGPTGGWGRRSRSRSWSTGRSATA